MQPKNGCGMKVACQTILWGSRLDDPVEVFQTIHELGFHGVEICQPPGVLPNAKELRAILEALDLEFVGFYGGLLGERVKYCGDYKPRYLAIEDWDESSCREALEAGFTLALHPHMFKRIHSLDGAGALLRDHPELKFLPDTAHLFLARDDPSTAIRQFPDRLAAVHLKDWTPTFGRSFHRYARGFVELGSGIVGLEKVLNSLGESPQGIEYDGWLVVEQDSTEGDPRTSVQRSIKWLCDHGICLIEKERNENVPRPMSQAPEETKPPKNVDRLIDMLIHVRNSNMRSFWNVVLQNLCELTQSKVASLWEFSPARNLLGLLAIHQPSGEPEKPFVMSCPEVLTGIAVESQVVSHLDAQKSYGNHRFAHPKLIDEFDISEMISIPVLNTYNPNHVELVINLYPHEGRDCPLTDQDLAKCADYVAIAYETLLDDVCQSAAATVNLAVVGNRKPARFIDEVLRTVQDVLNCDAVSIFLVDEARTQLRVISTTGIEWNVGKSHAEEYYSPGEGLTGKVWKSVEPLLTDNMPDVPGYAGKSSEKTGSRNKTRLITPFVDTEGNVVGVVRCANKHAKGSPSAVNIFSESDLSIIDAIAQAMIPHLLVLLVEERRAKTLGRLTHELKVPLTVIRGAAEFINRETKRKGFKFDYPYADNIISWHDLARKLLGNVDFFRYRSERLRLDLERVYLFADIFAPARQQIRPLLRERGFSSWNIEEDRFQSIPRVCVDRHRFQQVFFNLFSNSIKYAYDDPEAFQVDVVTRVTSSGYEILFRDRGPGIPEGYEEVVFEENIRGPNAEQDNVSGDGLGLWVVSEIIAAHGGTIEVSSRSQPTEFRIWLPKKIIDPW